MVVLTESTGRSPDSVEQYLSHAQEWCTSFLSRRGIATVLDRKFIKGGDDSAHSIDELLMDRSRTMLLGDPGQGKTVAAVDLVRRIAEGIKLQQSIPFFIPLTAVHSCIDDPISLLTNGNILPGSDVNLVKHAISTGQATLFFDGRDEISNGSLRIDVDRVIGKLVCDHPNLSYCFVSSRPWISPPEYASSFQDWQFKPLTNDEIETLMSNEIKEQSPHLDERGFKFFIDTAIKSFRRDLPRALGYQHLVRNPSYIRYLALLDGRLPNSAGEFLKSGIEAYLSSVKDIRSHSERANMGIAHDAIESLSLGNLMRDSFPVWREAAFQAHSKGTRSLPLIEIAQGGGWNEVDRMLRGALKMDMDSAAIRLEILKMVAETSNFFIIDDLDPKNHGSNGLFTHLGLQEYFAGTRLASSVATMSEGFEQALEPYLDDPWWRQPLVFAAGSEHVARRLLPILLNRGHHEIAVDAYVMAGKLYVLDETTRMRLDTLKAEMYP